MDECDAYKSCRIVDGKSRLVIVDKDGNIINKDPSREQLKSLEKEKEKYIKDKCCVCVGKN